MLAIGLLTDAEAFRTAVWRGGFGGRRPGSPYPHDGEPCWADATRRRGSGVCRDLRIVAGNVGSACQRRASLTSSPTQAPVGSQARTAGGSHISWPHVVGGLRRPDPLGMPYHRRVSETRGCLKGNAGGEGQRRGGDLRKTRSGFRCANRLAWSGWGPEPHPACVRPYALACPDGPLTVPF